ncbi:MAG TPA: hypothetical protein VFU47_02815, partial [Armatimonadota bacterium]|nr:hypothetical protein [Armatimonadota bacterium]
MPDPTEFGERALSAAQDLIRRGQEVAKRESRVIRLQTQISRLRAQRQRLFYQMGQKVFELFERDLVKNQDLRMMCQQIRGLDAEVELKREEIEQLRRPESRTEGGVDADQNGSAEIMDY